MYDVHTLADGFPLNADSHAAMAVPRYALRCGDGWYGRWIPPRDKQTFLFSPLAVRQGRFDAVSFFKTDSMEDKMLKATWRLETLLFLPASYPSSPWR